MNWAGLEVWIPVTKELLKKSDGGVSDKTGKKARSKEEVAWAKAVVVRSLSDDCEDTNGQTDTERSAVLGVEKLVVKLGGVDGKTITSTFLASDVHIRSSSKTPQPDDVTALFNLSEPEVLNSLMLRYKLGQIYTCSSDILIAINPFSLLPHLFSPEHIDRYADASSLSSLSSLPPHVFKTAAQAYWNLAETGKPQAILITGESGAGKTETAKCILFLLSCISTSSNPSEVTSGDNEITIEKKLLDTNPLLEAFGNAKTVRNQNSSRFGKYIELQFTPGSKGPLSLSGALIRTYLLERSRVVHANEGERSFHIFYQLVAGASDVEKKRWRLDTLPLLPNASIEGLDDAAEFSATRKAMSNIGISREESDQTFQSLSAILHLIQVTFMEDGDGEGSTVSDEHALGHLGAAACLLGLDKDQLLETVVTKKINTSDGFIATKLRPMEAKQALDSLSKSLYAELFDWIISRVNLSLLPSSMSQAGALDSNKTIGILDIYGFESLSHNDLEQLCINLTNEKLQQHFNSHVLSWEQREYEAEGIEWAKIDWVDNADIIEVIEGRKVLSVMNLLDEAAKLPKTTPQDLALKLSSSPFIKGSGRFAPAVPSSSLAPSFDARAAFELDHYAGTVVYQTTNMLMKNREASGAGSSERDLLSTSTLPLLQSIFSRVSNAVSNSASLSSVSSRFRSQLSKMMELIRGANPHFIRCIKPNPKGLPLTFDAPYSLNQLRCGGIMEAVRIARAGYAFKQTIVSFLARFWALTPMTLRLARDALVRSAAEDFLCQCFGAETKGQWAVGKTKVFLKAHLAAELEKRLSRLLFVSSTTIQCHWRGLVQRRSFLALRAAAVAFQASFRARLARHLCGKLREEQRFKAAACIQAVWRGRAVRQEYIALARSTTVLQAYWRARVCRLNISSLLIKHRAAIVIQRRWRLSQGPDDASDRRLSRGERFRIIVLSAMEADQAAKAMQAAYRGLVSRRSLLHLRALAQKERFSQRISSFNTRSQGGGEGVAAVAGASSRSIQSSGGGEGSDQTSPSSRVFGVMLSPVAVKASRGVTSGGFVRDRDQNQDDASNDLGAFQWVLQRGRWVKRTSKT